MPADRPSAAGLLAGGLLVLAAGCSDEAVGRAPRPAPVVLDNAPPTIDKAQLAYDPDLRTVHFYDLIADPKSGRKATWEVWLPDGTTAYPSGKTFQVRRGVDETGVLIKASDPPGPTSAGVRLADVPRKK
jgi:hypothetical protein